MKKCQFRDKESNSGQYAIRKPWKKPCGGGGGVPNFFYRPTRKCIMSIKQKYFIMLTARSR